MSIDLREEWRPVQGFEFYEVSNLGHIRSWARRGAALKRARKPHHLKLERLASGHLRAQLRRNHVDRRTCIHVLVAEAFIGPKPETAHLCRHLDGDPTNNHVENLAWGTFKDNEADKKRHGRSLIGERHHQAILTADNVRAIRLSSETGVALATRYGVSPSAICLVRKGRNWSHVS